MGIMTAVFKIRYKTATVEVEIESSDKSFVENKIKMLVDTQTHGAPQFMPKTLVRPSSARASRKGETAHNNSTAFSAASIANEINDSEDHEDLAKNILDKSQQLPKILTVLSFGEKESPDGLTTGEMEDVLEQLGSRILSANIATAIKGNQKYFAASGARRKGAVIRYKLNRKGKSVYNELLRGKNTERSATDK